MSTINIFIKYNNKTLVHTVSKDLAISEIYNLIEISTKQNVKKTHIIQGFGRILDDDKKLSDYPIDQNSLIRVDYSMGKSFRNEPIDILGHRSFYRFIKKMSKKSTDSNYFIISLLSFNVCKDTGSIIKNINQQLQPCIINNIIKKIKSDMDKININLILPDYNFIEYNKYFISNNYQPFIIHNQQAPQINEMFKIPQSQTFNTKSEKYFNRIVKFSTRLNNNCNLMNIFNVDEELANRIKFNFYFVGIKLSSTTDNNSNYNYYGFDYTHLVHKNTIIVMWTGDTFFTNGIKGTSIVGKVI